MAKLNLKNNNYQNIPVSNKFIEKYMPKANGSFVKVYLYGLLHSSQPDLVITNKDIAETLDMLESDVHNAWKYWEKLGLIKINNSSDNFDVEFLDLKESIKEEPPLITQSKPTYHPKELDIYINNNSEISHLYKITEEKLGKPLSSNDASTLFGFYDWLRLPVEVIILMLEYCVSIEKRNMRYIEKVAIDWADRGIDDAHKAEAHLKQLESKNNYLSLIKSSFGIINRDLVPTEKKYIDNPETKSIILLFQSIQYIYNK